MPTAYSTNLGLALPVQGELSGTWGDTVNNGITDYVDIAVAGTLTLNGDGAVTLSNTNGDASSTNISGTTAQYAILKITGTSTTKTITAPSLSKTYTVINASSYAVVVKASGQTGVTIPAGDKAFVAFNGTDYVRVGASAGGSDTQVQYNSSGNLAGSANLTFDGTKLTVGGLNNTALTASKAVFSDASKNLTSTGTLGVDQGGTGAATLTANNVLLGNGTSALQVVAPGTSGNVLTSNGTTWTSAAPAGGFSAVSVIGVNTNAANKTLYVFTASLTLTLPATPSVGDYVGVSNSSGTITCVIGRNGSNIMSLAENMTVDVVDAGFTLYYADATRGWVIL